MKQKTLLICITALLAIALFAYGGQSAPKENVELANPASVNCVEKGGELEIKTGEAGEYGICTFDDGSMCEEWAFFRGECEKGKIFADLINCKSYFDGCNTCFVTKGVLGGCTKKACSPEMLGEPKCLEFSGN